MLVFCAVKVFEGRALLLVINGWGSVKETSQELERANDFELA